MKYRHFYLAAIFIALIAATADFVSAQTVAGSLANASVSRGSAVKGTIVLTIPEGLHVNSNKPNSEYAIPTSVRLTGVGLKIGAIKYPEGANRKFQFSEDELNVYEGEILIPFSVTVPRNYRSKTISVKAVVRYQACTDEVCYPPRNKEVVMTASIR